MSITMRCRWWAYGAQIRLRRKNPACFEAGSVGAGVSETFDAGGRDVDQSAEHVVPVDARRCRVPADEVWIRTVWRGELARAVRAMPVVVVGIHAQDAFEMAPCENQNSVEATG
jgi:hypothetical protein